MSARREEPMTKISVGDRTPDFSRTDQNGRAIQLADFRGERAVVLFFYPADESPVCTREACAFRDAFQDFVAAGAAVIGVSGDSLERHRQFADRHQLPFHLISDADGSLREAFGVPKSLGLLPGRVTYVIDMEGRVRHLFNAQLAAERHVQEALLTVRKIAEQTD